LFHYKKQPFKDSIITTVLLAA